MQRRVSTAATGFLPDTRPGLLCSLGTVRPSPLWPPSLTISSLLSLAPSAPGFWSWVLGLQRGPPKFRGLGVLAEGVCALGVGVARWAARACGFYACPQLLAIRMLVAQASGMHQDFFLGKKQLLTGLVTRLAAFLLQEIDREKLMKRSRSRMNHSLFSAGQMWKISPHETNSSK